MQTAVRSLIRVHHSPIILSRAPPLAKLNSFYSSTLSSGTVLKAQSLGSASSYANRLGIRGQVKSVKMANVQPYLRVGIRNMGGEAPLDIEVFGKAASGTGSPSTVRGDCPFSQRIYLDLEEKNVPYKATYIQEGNNKPDWFMEKNPSGLMPTLRDGETWIQDSDKIAQYLEEKFPDPSLKTPAQYKNIGLGVFPAFTSWLKAKNPEDETKEHLLKELKDLDDHLKAHGPYIGGEKATDSAFALIPKLKHMQVALKYYYGWELPSELSATKKYIELLESRPSFKKTDVPDKMIVEGWGKKFELPGRLQPQAA
ncbi:unnamed protein product [Calypogeia fissa]